VRGLHDRHVVDDESRPGMAVDERRTRVEIAPEEHDSPEAVPGRLARDASRPDHRLDPPPAP